MFGFIYLTHDKVIDFPKFGFMVFHSVVTALLECFNFDTSAVKHAYYVNFMQCRYIPLALWGQKVPSQGEQSLL